VKHKGYDNREWIVRTDNTAGRLLCVAAGILLNKSEAEDIVQQSIEIALTKTQMRFESESQFMAWLAGVVKNCALNHRRKSIRRKTLPVNPQILGELEKAGTDTDHLPFDPQSGTLKENQNAFDDIVKNALESLTPDARPCLLLRSVQRLSYQEIEELTSIPSSSAMSHVHRSRLKLREILTAPGQPERRAK